jgi:hypothetical protein
MTITKCACGKRMSKHSSECTTCHKTRMGAVYAAAEAHVARGTCPQCGAGLYRNLALTGWWQCGRYGEPEFRKPEHRHLPKCSFQTFTQH